MSVWYYFFAFLTLTQCYQALAKAKDVELLEVNTVKADGVELLEVNTEKAKGVELLDVITAKAEGVELLEVNTVKADGVELLEVNTEKAKGVELLDVITAKAEGVELLEVNTVKADGVELLEVNTEKAKGVELLEVNTVKADGVELLEVNTEKAKGVELLDVITAKAEGVELLEENTVKADGVELLEVNTAKAKGVELLDVITAKADGVELLDVITAKAKGVELHKVNTSNIRTEKKNFVLLKVLPLANFILTIPKECLKRGICEHIPNYPQKYVSNIIRKLSNINIKLHTDDEILEDARIKSDDDRNYESLCPTNKNLTYPQAACDVNDNKWHLILNSKEIQQNALTRVCKDVPTRPGNCSNIALFQRNYYGQCRQEYYEKNLIGLDVAMKNVVVVTTRMESCCVCQLFSSDDN